MIEPFVLTTNISGIEAMGAHLWHINTPKRSQRVHHAPATNLVLVLLAPTKPQDVVTCLAPQVQILHHHLLSYIKRHGIANTKKG